MDELRFRLIYQRELRDCCVLCFTETWLTPVIPDCALQADRFSIHHMEDTASLDKVKGEGTCFLINTSWCSDVATLPIHCCPDPEYLSVKCCPCYIPPHVDVKNALDLIYTGTNTLETKFPESLFIVASNFKQANHKQVMPKYHQHISCPTRELNILDHCCTTTKDAYRSIPCPHFGKSDHSAVFLLPVYKQKLKQENSSRKEV
eukprot:g27516.t1